MTKAITIGDWGFGDSRGSGRIVCDPVNAEAVQAAYDAIEEGDLGPNVLDGVEAAGGHFVPDVMDLVDSETNEVIRQATDSEVAESLAAGREGHIEVDGRKCYVAH